MKEQPKMNIGTDGKITTYTEVKKTKPKKTPEILEARINDTDKASRLELYEEFSFLSHNIQSWKLLLRQKAEGKRFDINRTGIDKEKGIFIYRIQRIL